MYKVQGATADLLHTKHVHCMYAHVKEYLSTCTHMHLATTIGSSISMLQLSPRFLVQLVREKCTENGLLIVHAITDCSTVNYSIPTLPWL